MEQKHYECPQCSSTNIDLITEDYGICESCGTKINFKDSETPKLVVKTMFISSKMAVETILIRKIWLLSLKTVKKNF